MINKDAIEKWVAALESGKYGQTTGKLTDGEGNYCCLGVLCEIAVQEGVIPPRGFRVWCDDCSCCDDAVEYEYDGSALTLPTSVAEWAFGDANDTNPPLSHTTTDDIGEPASGVSMNDSLGFNFEEIAAEIRAKFLETDVTDSGTDSGEVSNVAATTAGD